MLTTLSQDAPERGHMHYERRVHGFSRFQLAQDQGKRRPAGVLHAPEHRRHWGDRETRQRRPDDRPEPARQPVRRDRLPRQSEPVARPGDQSPSPHRGRARRDRSGHRDHARADGARPDRRMCRGRGPRGHHRLGRVQGERSGRRGARAPDHGASEPRPDPDHRPEQPRGDEPDDRPERLGLQHHHGSAGQDRLPQPERGPRRRGARLEPAGQRRLQRLRLGRVDARRRLGRPDRLPRQ